MGEGEGEGVGEGEGEGEGESACLGECEGERVRARGRGREGEGERGREGERARARGRGREASDQRSPRLEGAGRAPTALVKVLHCSRRRFELPPPLLPLQLIGHAGQGGATRKRGCQSAAARQGSTCSGMRRSKEQGEGEDEDRDTPTASSAWEAAMAALEDPATVGGCAHSARRSHPS